MRPTWQGQRAHETSMAGTDRTGDWHGRDRQHMSDTAGTPTGVLHSNILSKSPDKHQTFGLIECLTKAVKNSLNHLRILSPETSHVHIIDSFFQQTFAHGILSEEPLLFHRAVDSQQDKHCLMYSSTFGEMKEYSCNTTEHPPFQWPSSTASDF